MRILFFSNDFPRPADSTRAVFNLRMCEGLAIRNAIRVFSPVGWTEPRLGESAALRAPAFPVTYRTYYYPPRILLAQRGRFMWWSLRRHLMEEARRWEPDIVLAYWAHPDGEVALKLGRAMGIPIVQIVGGSDVLLLRNDAARWARVQRVLTSADAVVTIGRHLAEEVVRLGVPGTRVHALYRPVDTKCFRPGNRLHARRELGIDQPGALLLWVGRLEKVKAVDILLEAFARIRQRVGVIRLFLVGGGPEEGALRSHAARLQIDDAVHFVGAVPHEQLPRWYQAADTTILSSLSEGVPNVLLESVACGTPFVATAVGGVPEIADDAVDLVVPAGDATRLAEAVMQQIGRIAHGRRQARPTTPDAFARQLESILSGALSGGIPRARVAL